MTQEERVEQLEAEGWLDVPRRLHNVVRGADLPCAMFKELSKCLAPAWVVELADTLAGVPLTAEHFNGHAIMSMTGRAVRSGAVLPETALAAVRLGGPRALQDIVLEVS